MSAYGTGVYGLGVYGVGSANGGAVPLIPAGITSLDWIEQTRRYLLSQHREELTQLASAYNPGDGVLQLNPMVPGVQTQAYLEIDTEMFYVTSVTANSCTVIPAQLGTKDVGHAINAVVRINPRFPNSVIYDALNNVLRHLGGPTYYSMQSTQLIWNPAQFGYDMGVLSINAIYDVDFPLVGQTILYPRVYNYELKRNQPTQVFPSGNAIFFYDVPGVQGGQIINVTYSCDFSLLTDATANTDVSVTGLPTSGYDLPPIGAAIQLMSGREIKRNFVEGQPEPRRATEVGPGAVQASVNGLKALWQDRYNSEVDSLAQQYPRRRQIMGRSSWSNSWR